MEKQWKNRGTMMKKWSKTVEKQWNNCGSDVGPKMMPNKIIRVK